MTDYELVISWILDLCQDPDHEAKTAFDAIADIVDANRSQL